MTGQHSSCGVQRLFRLLKIDPAHPQLDLGLFHLEVRPRAAPNSLGDQ